MVKYGLEEILFTDNCECFKDFFVQSENLIYYKTDLSFFVRESNRLGEELLKGSDTVSSIIINPSLSDFINTCSDDSSYCLFSGVITFRGNDVAYTSLNGRIYKSDKEFVILAEYDSKELEKLYFKLSENERLLNNTNRELIKRKKELSETLSELKETQVLLIHSEKMNSLGQLVAGIAHEINNPLAFISGNIDYLETGVSDIKSIISDIRDLAAENCLAEKVNEVLNTACYEDLIKDLSDLQAETADGIKRILSIVKDLKNFSRIDEAEVKKVNIADNINSTLNILKGKLNEKKISIEINYNEVREIYCYPAQLNQVVLNILLNSIYAVKNKDGCIIIDFTEDDNFYIISITDNGEGIKEENINKIFNPFYTTKPPGEGTGIGLSIVNKIIRDLHKGDIRVESVYGEGTKFRLFISKIL